MGDEQRVWETKTLEVHGCIHVQLTLRRSNATPNGRKTLTAGGMSTAMGDDMSAVMRDDILHAGKVDERRVGIGW